MSVEAPPEAIDVLVVVPPRSRGALAALAFAHSVASDVQRVRVVHAGDADDRTMTYLAGRVGRRPLFIVPTARTRARWLYPIANWRALRLARRLARRGAVATVPS